MTSFSTLASPLLSQNENSSQPASPWIVFKLQPSLFQCKLFFNWYLVCLHACCWSSKRLSWCNNDLCYAAVETVTQSYALPISCRKTNNFFDRYSSSRFMQIKSRCVFSNLFLIFLLVLHFALCSMCVAPALCVLLWTTCTGCFTIVETKRLGTNPGF